MTSSSPLPSSSGPGSTTKAEDEIRVTRGGDDAMREPATVFTHDLFSVATARGLVRVPVAATQLRSALLPSDARDARLRQPRGRGKHVDPGRSRGRRERADRPRRSGGPRADVLPRPRPRGPRGRADRGTAGGAVEGGTEDRARDPRRALHPFAAPADRVPRPLADRAAALPHHDRPRDDPSLPRLRGDLHRGGRPAVHRGDGPSDRHLRAARCGRARDDAAGDLARKALRRRLLEDLASGSRSAG